MDAKRRAELDWQVDCLSARADALLADTRADCASGTKTVYSSAELNLGRQGYGEVEFHVALTYKIDVSLKGLKSVDWYDDDDKKVARGSVPTAAIETAVRKIIDRKAASAWLGEL